MSGSFSWDISITSTYGNTFVYVITDRHFRLYDTSDEICKENVVISMLSLLDLLLFFMFYFKYSCGNGI